MIASRLANPYEIKELEGLIKNKNSDIEFFGDFPIEKRKIYQIRKMLFGLTVAAIAGIAAVAALSPDKASSQPLIDSNIGNGMASYEVELPEKKTSSDRWTISQHIAHEIEVDPLKTVSLNEENHSQWASQLNQQGHSFLALTTQIESIAEKPYWDNCGINVGVGYCINARVDNYGEERVREDLLKAGISSDTVDVLLDGRRHQQRGLDISPQESLRLLFITQSDYQQIAKDALGEEFFSTLKPEQQQAISWLAYNLGDGIKDYKRMITALHAEQWGNAMVHMVPHYNENGEWKRNNRAASYIMATFSSPDGLNKVLENPEDFEAAMKRGVSPVEYVNPSFAQELKKSGQLPPSPYSVGDNLADTREFRNEWEQQSQRSRFQNRRNSLASVIKSEEVIENRNTLKFT